MPLLSSLFLANQRPYIRMGMLAVVTGMVLSLMACQPVPDTKNNVQNSDSQNNTTLNNSTQNSPAQPSTNQNTSGADTTPPLAKLNQPITTPITILAIGDSLTEGLGVAEQDSYPAQLQAQLREAGYSNVSVVNSGLSGETSTGLVNRLDWALKTQPDITILTTGANDAMRGVPVSTVDENIRTAIKRLQASGSTVILGGMEIYDNMGDDYVNQFSRIYPRIAKDTGVAYIPFFLNGVAGDANLNQKDAIHPTKEGYTYVVNNNILPVLIPVLTEVVEEKSSNTQNSP